MVDHDAFLKSIDKELTRSYVLMFISLLVLVGTAFMLLFIGGQIYSVVIKYMRARSCAIGKHDNTMLYSNPDDDDALQIVVPEKEEQIPGSAEFSKTLEQRAGDKSVHAFNTIVNQVCQARKTAGDGRNCTVDPGLGGGVAAAFDPTKD